MAEGITMTLNEYRDLDRGLKSIESKVALLTEDVTEMVTDMRSMVAELTTLLSERQASQ